MSYHSTNFDMGNLQAFVAIVREGSFARAAEALCVTQPAVSRQIRVLERELRAPLFHRVGRRALLSDAGSALLPWAEQCVAAAQAGARAAVDANSSVARLTIAASTTAATYLLPSILQQFSDSDPEVVLRIRTGPSARVAETVADGEADLGLMTGPPVQHTLDSTELAPLVTQVIVYPGHDLVNVAGAVRPRDVGRYPLIVMQAGRTLREHVDAIFRAEGVRPEVAMELDSVEAIKHMVAARLAISLLPAIAARREIDSGSLVGLPLDGQGASRRSIHLVSRRGAYRSPADRAFTAHATAVAVTLLATRAQAGPG